MRPYTLHGCAPAPRPQSACTSTAIRLHLDRNSHYLGFCTWRRRMILRARKSAPNSCASRTCQKTPFHHTRWPCLNTWISTNAPSHSQLICRKYLPPPTHRERERARERDRCLHAYLTFSSCCRAALVRVSVSGFRFGFPFRVSVSGGDLFLIATRSPGSLSLRNLPTLVRIAPLTMDEPTHPLWPWMNQHTPFGQDLRPTSILFYYRPLLINLIGVVLLYDK